MCLGFSRYYEIASFHRAVFIISVHHGNADYFMRLFVYLIQSLDYEYKKQKNAWKIKKKKKTHSYVSEVQLFPGQLFRIIEIFRVKQ